MGPGAIGSPRRAAHDGPRAARAVRLPAARGRRRRARCSSCPSAIATSSAWSPGSPTAPSTTPWRRGACSRRGCRPSWSTSRCGWRPSTARRRRARSRCCCRRRARGPRPRCGRSRRARSDAGERLSDRQRALLASLPRFAGGDLAALRRLEARGLVSIAPRVVRRAPLHVPVGRRARAARADRRSGGGAARDRRRPRRASGCCCTASPGRARPRSTCGPRRRRSPQGRGVIVLVPEIALTPQIVARFVARFGDTVAVLHSKLSAGERHDEWARLRAGEARVCVGPRSAVFAPMRGLGLVVVDEEHDSSYKHEGDPRYDARRVAERRAAQAGAVLVAGSATPRPESGPRARRACACPRASTGRACRRSRSSTCARRGARCTRAPTRRWPTRARRSSCSTAAAGRTS